MSNETGTMDADGTRWFKSSASHPASCVEVGFRRDGQVGVRDTKDRTLPPHVYDRGEWEAFLTGAKRGEFDLP